MYETLLKLDAGLENEWLWGKIWAYTQLTEAEEIFPAVNE